MLFDVTTVIVILGVVAALNGAGGAIGTALAVRYIVERQRQSFAAELRRISEENQARERGYLDRIARLEAISDAGIKDSAANRSLILTLARSLPQDVFNQITANNVTMRDLVGRDRSET